MYMPIHRNVSLSSVPESQRFPACRNFHIAIARTLPSSGSAHPSHHLRRTSLCEGLRGSLLPRKVLRGLCAVGVSDSKWPNRYSNPVAKHCSVALRGSEKRTSSAGFLRGFSPFCKCPCDFPTFFLVMTRNPMHMTLTNWTDFLPKVSVWTEIANFVLLQQGEPGLANNFEGWQDHQEENGRVLDVIPFLRVLESWHG